VRTITLLCLLASVAVVVALPTAAQGQAKPASLTLFAAKCASCHSIGEGKRVGPDLKGAVDRRKADFLVDFIRTPSKFLDSDPYMKDLLKAYNGVRMPDLGLNEADSKALVELLDVCSKKKCDFSSLFKDARQASKADINKGQELFWGELALLNGGPPCTDCHVVRGHGQWAPGSGLASDLTHVAGLLGDRELDERLAKPVDPLHVKTYEGAALTDGEVFAVRAYLYDANRFMDDPETQVGLTFAGLAGGVLLLLLLGGVRRFRRSAGEEGHDV